MIFVAKFWASFILASKASRPAGQVGSNGAPKVCHPSPAILWDFSTKSLGTKWCSAIPNILVVGGVSGGGFKIEHFVSFKSSAAWGQHEEFKKVNSVRYAFWFLRPPRLRGAGDGAEGDLGTDNRTTPKERGSCTAGGGSNEVLQSAPPPTANMAVGKVAIKNRHTI